MYLEGFIQDENLRFRKEPIRFHVKPPSAGVSTDVHILKWEVLKKEYGGFVLKVEHGEAKQGEVVGVLGPNGIGKTTFVKILAGIEKLDTGMSPTENLNHL